MQFGSGLQVTGPRSRLLALLSCPAHVKHPSASSERRRPQRNRFRYRRRLPASLSDAHNESWPMHQETLRARDVCPFSEERISATIPSGLCAMYRQSTHGIPTASSLRRRKPACSLSWVETKI